MKKSGHHTHQPAIRGVGKQGQAALGYEIYRVIFIPLSKQLDTFSLSKKRYWITVKIQLSQANSARIRPLALKTNMCMEGRLLGSIRIEFRVMRGGSFIVLQTMFAAFALGGVGGGGGGGWFFPCCKVLFSNQRPAWRCPILQPSPQTHTQTHTHTHTVKSHRASLHQTLYTFHRVNVYDIYTN